MVYRNNNGPDECAECGYDKHYEICHILPINSFTEDSNISEVNDFDNLVALCPNCHWEFDNGLLNISSRIPAAS